MKAFLGGVAAMVLIAVGAAFVLDSQNITSAQRYTSERGSVRLDPGS